MSLTRDDDPYTGEIFRSNDERDDGKRIRVTEQINPTQWGVPGERYYYYHRVDEYGQPVSTRRVRISEGQLNKAYTKVSR